MRPAIAKELMKLSPSENLLQGTEEEYFNAGYSALSLCKRILLQAGISPKHIIDFPSGYGRVLRWFKYEYPLAKLTAVETDQLALDFVSKQFGSSTVLANKDLNFEIPKEADLIFSGSPLTHFNEIQWDRFLEVSIDALAPGAFLCLQPMVE